MARPLRLKVPGGVYHIMARGNECRDIFWDDADRRHFLFVLQAVTERFNVFCHSYCLMGNHYHLLLETPDGNISLAIRQLNGVYAQWFNRRHHRVGHLFQGRFTSKLVEKETYLLTVSRYIVLNPVRANLVSRPSDWVWSSYRAHVGRIQPPSFLTTDWILTHFDIPDRSCAQKAYAEFVNDDADASDFEPDARPILGGDAFVGRFRKKLTHLALLSDIPRLQRFVARPSLEQIFRRCSDHVSRNSRIRQAYVEHGYTMTEIARHLGLHVMTISRAVRSSVEM